jgi:RNA polymerase sigma factor (sigma-70 family)
MQKDAQLVEQTLSGNHQAFHILITQYYTAIYNTILSWVKGPEDAKDLTQEVFISAYQKLSSLRHPERFYSWLRQIARHISQNWQRKGQVNLVPLDNDLISKEPSVDEVLILRETLAKVMEAIDSLPESEKRLLKEHYLDDISYDELEAKHGVSTKALVVRLVRARQKIRDQLEKTLSAFVAFLHDHTESILTEGVEIMKLSVKTKLIAGGIVIMLATVGTGVLVNHYYTQNNSEQISSEADLKMPAKSVSGDGKARESGYKNTKVISNAMAYTGKQNEKANLKEYDQSNANQIQENQGYMPVMERLKAFKQSSKEYQELQRQFGPLVRRFNELQREGTDLSTKVHELTQKVIENPQLPTEEEQKKSEQLLAQMPPDIVQRYEKGLREAKSRKEEREIIVSYWEDLQARLNQVIKESKLVEKQMNEVDDAIINLLRQNRLPINQEEINEAIKKDQEHFRNLNR